MARVGRFAGALIAESEGCFFLVGEPKEPCEGRPLALRSPWLRIDVEGDALSKLLADRFVIARNGSVSERLWRLVAGEAQDEVDARWLGEIPASIWQIVRDTVLRCS